MDCLVEDEAWSTSLNGEFTSHMVATLQWSAIGYLEFGDDRCDALLPHLLVGESGFTAECVSGVLHIVEVDCIVDDAFAINLVVADVEVAIMSFACNHLLVIS